jgi:predicted metal-dependent HD superfamily phosphohydrolase
VLDALLDAGPLYRTAPGRARWEAAARRNLAAERAALSA